MLDVRKPIAYLFVIIGGLLAVYGIFDPQTTHLQTVGSNVQTLSMNLNLYCGSSMLLFAVVLLALAKSDELKMARDAARHPSLSEETVPERMSRVSELIK